MRNDIERLSEILEGSITFPETKHVMIPAALAWRLREALKQKQALIEDLERRLGEYEQWEE